MILSPSLSLSLPTHPCTLVSGCRKCIWDTGCFYMLAYTRHTRVCDTVGYTTRRRTWRDLPMKRIYTCGEGFGDGSCPSFLPPPHPPPDSFLISTVTSCDTPTVTCSLSLPLSQAARRRLRDRFIYRVASRWRDAGGWARDTQRTICSC